MCSRNKKGLYKCNILGYGRCLTYLILERYIPTNGIQTNFFVKTFKIQLKKLRARPMQTFKELNVALLWLLSPYTASFHGMLKKNDCWAALLGF